MRKVVVQQFVTLDGFAAGPNQSEENPLGEGGEGLHDRVVQLASWRQGHGADRGEENAVVTSERFT